MKTTTRIIAVVLAVLMLLSGSMGAFAADAQQPTPADNTIDTSVYVKTALDNPKLKPRNAVRLLSAAAAFADLDTAIKDKLSHDLLTGQNVVLALDGIVDAISKALEDDPQLAMIGGAIKYLFANNYLISGLESDAKFAGALAKIRKASDDGIQTISDVVDAGIEFTSADFGFADGDAYGFVDALVCALAQTLTQLGVRSILGDFTDSVEDGVYVAGNYDLFVPLYELLELDPISSVAFTKRVEQAESSDDLKPRFRAAANLTLKPVADLLTKIENGGVDAVIDVLPRLLYALDSGMVNDLLAGLLRDKSLYGLFQFNDVLEKIDLNTDLLWNVVDKNFVSGTEEEPAGFDFDKDGVKDATLPMTKDQFDAIIKKLTYAADPVVRPSVSCTQKNRLALDTDKALVCAILFNAAIDLLETADGAAFAVKAINGVLENKIAKWFAGRFLSLFGSEAGRFVLARVQDILTFVASAAARISALVRARRA